MNGEEVLPEYSYLSNIGKSSVLQSSYLGILSLYLCSTSYLPVVYLYLYGKCHLNSDVRNSEDSRDNPNLQVDTFLFR